MFVPMLFAALAAILPVNAQDTGLPSSCVAFMTDVSIVSPGTATVTLTTTQNVTYDTTSTVFSPTITQPGYRYTTEITTLSTTTTDPTPATVTTTVNSPINDIYNGAFNKETAVSANIKRQVSSSSGNAPQALATYTAFVVCTTQTTAVNTETNTITTTTATTLVINATTTATVTRTSVTTVTGPQATETRHAACNPNNIARGMIDINGKNLHFQNYTYREVGAAYPENQQIVSSANDSTACCEQCYGQHADTCAGTVYRVSSNECYILLNTPAANALDVPGALLRRATLTASGMSTPSSNGSVSTPTPGPGACNARAVFLGTLSGEETYDVNRAIEGSNGPCGYFDLEAIPESQQIVKTCPALPGSPSRRRALALGM